MHEGQNTARLTKNYIGSFRICSREGEQLGNVH